MRHLFLLAGILLWTLMPGPEPAQMGEPKALDNDFALKDLPDAQIDFKALPYLQAAILLQKMPREDALKKLRGLAKEEELNWKNDGMKVVILCRMLVAKKKDGQFRAPGLGYPACLGNSKPSDWPLVPIEIVDGIPFLVVRGYDGEGLPELAADYLKYCIGHCDWSNTRFALPSKDAQKNALEKLLALPKWKTLSTYEREFLSMQIK